MVSWIAARMCSSSSGALLTSTNTIGMATTASSCEAAILKQKTTEGEIPFVDFAGADADLGKDNLTEERLGKKAYYLSVAASLGVGVPAGFVLSAELAHYYWNHQESLPDDLIDTLKPEISKIAQCCKSDQMQSPLLLSLRISPKQEIPKLFESILGLGFNDKTVLDFAKIANDERFAFDCYRRFMQSFSVAVFDVDPAFFEEELEILREERGYRMDAQMTATDWRELIHRFRDIISREAEAEIPAELDQQIELALSAAYRHWRSPRANNYRVIHNLKDDNHLPVIVQQMVFGNRDEDSALGFFFTRNPNSGEKEFDGDFLFKAIGSEFDLGIHNPQLISKNARLKAQDSRISLEEALPEAFKTACEASENLERHFKQALRLEFIIDSGNFHVLQVSPIRPSAKAALKIAVDMVKEKIINEGEAILSIDPPLLEQLLHPTVDPAASVIVIANGLAASPGGAQGELVFSAEEAENARRQGRSVVLVRTETSPEDVYGMIAAMGVITSRGGMTSHAAVVARGMGKPCVVGAGSLHVDAQEGVVETATARLQRGDMVTVDGSRGRLLKGAAPMRMPDMSSEFAVLMAWVDSYRRMEVRANAETAEEARTARNFGAAGIGLCRTEHMFFLDDRILAMREMVLSSTVERRRAALAKLLPMQRQDFIELFHIMSGTPVTIRLLDPPLHEFLPHSESDMIALGKSLGISAAAVRQRSNQLQEFNPMLGHRGCRLAISYPEIPEMQTRAIIEAAIQAGRESGQPVEPEIMIPLVSDLAEFTTIRSVVDAAAADVMHQEGTKVRYKVGTMIELPRAAISAKNIAQAADFFSFGTNDLTQMTYGISRDDAALFMDTYLQQNIFSRDPFISLDREGVGYLIEYAVAGARAQKDQISLGICGEHGGDSMSIMFCEEQKLDYVSCSPFRVPLARLASAQATIRMSSADLK